MNQVRNDDVLVSCDVFLRKEELRDVWQGLRVASDDVVISSIVALG